MDIVSRHKKPGGFIKLVQSLETTPPLKRKEILDAIREQDPDLALDAEHCILHFHELIEMKDEVIQKVLSQVIDPKIIAFAIFKTPLNWQEKVKKNIPPTLHYPLRDEFEKIIAVTVGEQLTAQYKIIKCGRKLQDEGRLVLKAYSNRYPAY